MLNTLPINELQLSSLIEALRFVAKKGVEVDFKRDRIHLCDLIKVKPYK